MAVAVPPHSCYATGLRMKNAVKPTLNQVFALSLFALTAMLAALFYVVFASSRAATIESSERVRDQASREIGRRVTAFLAQAPETVARFQREVANGLIDTHDLRAVESTLLTLLLATGDLGEVTLTYGERTGYADGEIQLAPDSRGQLTAARSVVASGGEEIWTRHVFQERGAFVAEQRQPKTGAPFSAQAAVRATNGTPDDPTAHPTFLTPARERLRGQLLWSDLHWSQLDEALPPERRRVEVSVQQVVNDATGKFLGVLRVGLLTQQLDSAVKIQLASEGQTDPHRIFICDADGHLITRLSPADRIVEEDDNLRVAPANLPAEVQVALAMPALRDVSETKPVISGEVNSAQADFLTTFRALPDSQDWIVGIVVPRAFYLGKLAAMRDRLLVISLGIIAALIGGGGLILRGVKRAQAQIRHECLQMNAFEFAPAPTASAFRDVSEVLESLESAKTAMRAMGKYVPLNLVRRLYREKSEPVLGGEDHEVTLMFTDIVGFTSLAEQLPPNQLADALGRYLAVMARIIQQETGGTIDKFIGDAVMAVWNVPEPVPDHPRMACLAALRCREAVRTLAQSAEWRGLPAFETRFGLHRDTALVGHFGAPDRMDYTALGDAVNLASRLEGLNKHYGTTIIVSEKVAAQTREHFIFRRLDRVAVQGKTQAVEIFELIGESTAENLRSEIVANYERAFDAYLTRDFATAAALLEKQKDTDAPSARLLERCAAFQLDPPPPDWAGVAVAAAK